jgi:glycosyltransferase involved in cell wall biosynthesis
MEELKPMRVVFITTILPKYRIPFHEAVRVRLAEAGIQYQLVYGQPDASEEAKNHCGEIPWATVASNRYIPVGNVLLVWQPVLKQAMNSDLVIATQENRLLLNYVIQLMPERYRPKFALWGHGKNFQSTKSMGVAAQWKRFWTTRCDWWFAYTDQTRKIVEGYGFPSEKITVFNNCIDTREVRAYAEQISNDDLLKMKRKLNIFSSEIGIYVGGLYPHKRLGFLVDSAIEVQREVPSFVLLIVGGGVDRPIAEKAASQYPFIQYLGPKFGREKVALLKLANVFLMPGLVGLSVLDSAAAGLPIVTSSYPYHSPEICYVEPGRNGLIVEHWRDPKEFARATVSLLKNDKLRKMLSTGASATSELYTIDRMVDNFCDGVRRAVCV